MFANKALVQDFQYSSAAGPPIQNDVHQLHQLPQQEQPPPQQHEEQTQQHATTATAATASTAAETTTAAGNTTVAETTAAGYQPPPLQIDDQLEGGFLKLLSSPLDEGN